jgi:hypothetical protein
MAVMAAGVHAPVDLRCPGHTGFFREGQGVNVATQGNMPACCIGRQRGDSTCAGAVPPGNVGGGKMGADGVCGSDFGPG